MYNNDKEYMIAVGELLKDKKVQEMHKYIQHGNITTLDHCLTVSYLTYKWCKSLGLDYISAARGALLHDFFLYDWHDKTNSAHSLHGFTHANTALSNAENAFSLNKKERDIIKKHMFPLNPLPPRYFESVIVCFADKVCAAKETFGRFITKEA